MTKKGQERCLIETKKVRVESQRRVGYSEGVKDRADKLTGCTWACCDWLGVRTQSSVDMSIQAVEAGVHCNMMEKIKSQLHAILLSLNR